MTTRRGLRRRVTVGAILAGTVFLGFTGCGDDAEPTGGAGAVGHGHQEDGHAHDDAPPSASFGADEVDTTLTVTLRDFAYEGIPARVTGPNVRFVSTIAGSNRHELDVVDADGETVAVIPPFTTSDGQRTLDAVLAPGTYSVRCLVQEGARTHADLGMRQDLVVG